MPDDRVLAKKTDITFFGDIVRSKKGITNSLSLEQVKEGVAELKGATDEWNGDYSEEGGNLVVPSGSLDITENGEYDVVDKEFVNVEVNGSGPEWDGDYSEEGELPKPEGTLEITENGEYDVMDKANVNVNVVGSGEDRLKAFFDAKKSCFYEFMSQSELTAEELNSILKYDDTSNVTRMDSMFRGCTKLTTIPQLDTSKVTTMEYMFYSCNKLTTIPQLDTSSVTNMLGMFNTCPNLTTIPQLDTSNVTTMSNTFVNCSNLTTIPQLNTSNVTNMGYMFNGCSKLTTIPQLDTSNVTTMNGMFQGCAQLTTIPQLDTSNVTNMGYMFNGCSKLTTIPQLDTSNVTSMETMFFSCNKLTSVPKLDVSNVTSFRNMFYYCTSLTSVFLDNIKANLTVGSSTEYGHLLTVDSLVGLCKECIKQSSSRTLTVGTANIEKLSTVTVKFTDSTIVPSETAIAVGEKGEVEVCESTDEGAIYISEYMSLKNWTLA